MGSKKLLQYPYYLLVYAKITWLPVISGTATILGTLLSKEAKQIRKLLRNFFVSRQVHPIVE